VYLNDASGTQIKLPGIDGQPAGEIVIINSETAAATSYGRDLSPANGAADGVAFKHLPYDLNCDGDTSDAAVLAAQASRFPVGIIIRWPGKQNEERVEVWTVISRY
jgi:hypothetical protein